MSKIDKPIDFVIQDGELKIGEGHSRISGGRNVDYAGEIITDADGNILYWQNGSGHYKPDSNDAIGKQQTVNLFKEYIGIDITNLFKKK